MCTVAAVIAFLGYMPPRGTVISVPRSQAEQLTPRQRNVAARCAGRRGIKWTIDEGR